MPDAVLVAKRDAVRNSANYVALSIANGDSEHDRVRERLIDFAGTILDLARAEQHHVDNPVGKPVDVPEPVDLANAIVDAIESLVPLVERLHDLKPDLDPKQFYLEYLDQRLRLTLATAQRIAGALTPAHGPGPSSG
jgi:hypothetical protein